MRKNIRLLEDRVTRVAGRLRQLSDERGKLAEELETLKGRLEQVGEPPGEGDTASVAGREEIISGLQATLADLRGD